MNIIIISLFSVYFFFGISKTSIINKHPLVMLTFGLFLGFLYIWLLGITDAIPEEYFKSSYFHLTKEQVKSFMSLSVLSLSASFITSSIILRSQRSSLREKDYYQEQLKEEEKAIKDCENTIAEELEKKPELEIPFEVKFNLIPIMKGKNINPDFLHLDIASQATIYKKEAESNANKIRKKLTAYKNI